MTTNPFSRHCAGALILAASIAGCGGSSAPASGPSVSSTSPANAATGVAINTAFAVTFSEAMDPATLTASTFTMTGTGGAAVTGAVSSLGVTSVFRPSANLAAGTVYTATVTTGAKSAAGKALVSSYSWQVTTGSTADTSRPTVSSTSPADSSSGAALNGDIAVTFDRPIDPATLVVVLKRGVATVAGVVSYSGVTASFHPAAALAANTSYAATVVSAKDLAGNALANSYGWSFKTGAASDTTAPAVSSTSPADGATAVAINSAVSVSFSKPMAAATLTTASFTVTAPGAAPVAGTVTYAGQTATFQPRAALAASQTFTATVTNAAADLAGNTLAVFKVWTFTTGAAADTSAPTVTSTSPLPAAPGVLTTASIQATFSKPMSPRTINTSTFTLSAPGGAAVPGLVSFDAPTKVATFRGLIALTPNTTYQAKLHGVTDLAGNPLASDYTWGFTTGSHANLAPVLLGSSANYAILAKAAISTVPTSKITGDVGLSPAAESYITGFSLTDATGYATTPQVVGKVYAADQAPPTPSTLTTAVSDMETGYTDAAGRPTPDFLELATGAIGGLTLTPGLYKWTSTVTIPTDVTLNGSATDVWIFQISGDLTMSAAKNVFLTGGAKAKNVFWQVAGAIAIGTTAHFEGIILSQTAISLGTGASMNGRLLAQTAVALDSVMLTQPAP